MNDSTKRAIRTFVQAVLGVAAAVAVAVPLLPPGGQRYAAVVAGAAVVAATISKVWAALEDSGKLPDWLRDERPADPVKLSEEAYAEAWHAGHTAAMSAVMRTQADPREVTRTVRPVVEPDEPGRHSPERTGETPTSMRAAPTSEWSATARLRRPPAR